MAYRTPRGYDVNRPPYQEISEGTRPESSAVPMEAYDLLPPVRIDEISHDPIVLDAGTVVGIATGGLAKGKLFPAHGLTGHANIQFRHHSDGATWGLSATDTGVNVLELTTGPVYPLGMIFQPIYSFKLQSQFTNYKRTDNVGIVTDYLVQIPATTSLERSIEPGELVMVNQLAQEAGQVAAGTASMGTLQSYPTLNATVPGATALLNNPDPAFIVGRCYGKLTFASGTASVNTVFSDDVANVTLSTAGAAEFKGLNRVQTVPGLGLSGSGTAGVPSWLVKAQADGSGNYVALTILVRL